MAARLEDVFSTRQRRCSFTGLCTPVPWLGWFAEVCHNQKDNAPHNANFRCHSNDRWWGWRGLTNMAVLGSEVVGRNHLTALHLCMTEVATTTARRRLLLNQTPGPGATGVACTSRGGQRLNCPTCRPQSRFRSFGTVRRRRVPGNAARQLRCVPLDRATLLVQSPVRPGRVALAKQSCRFF